MQEAELNKKIIELYSTYQNELNEAFEDMNDLFENAIEKAEGDDRSQGQLMFLQGHLRGLTTNARSNYNNGLYELMLKAQKEEYDRYETRQKNIFLKYYDLIRSKLQWQN